MQSASICLGCMEDGAQPLPPLKAQPWSLILFVQILIDWGVAHATDDQHTAILCTPAWKATVTEAFNAALAGTKDKSCSACHRPQAFAVMSYAFDVSYEALAWMPLRGEVSVLALDNMETLHEMCVHICPVASLIAAQG